MNQQRKHIKTHFVDTSALTKLYFNEQGSDAVRNNIGKALNYTTSLCIAELIGIIKCKWLYRKPKITTEEYIKISYELMGDIRNNSFKIIDINISDFNIFNRIEYYCSKYKNPKNNKDINLDIVDASQIFTLSEGPLSILNGDTKPLFITADEDLEIAARAEGFSVWFCEKENYPI